MSGGHGDRGDRRIGLVRVERAHHGLEAAHLNGAGELELLADQPRQIDVEALRVAVRPGEIERRVVDLGDEADDVDPRHIGPLRPPPRVPESRHLHVRVRERKLCRRGAGSDDRGQHQQAKDSEKKAQQHVWASQEVSGHGNLWLYRETIPQNTDRLSLINKAVGADQWRRVEWRDGVLGGLGPRPGAAAGVCADAVGRPVARRPQHRRCAGRPPVRRSTASAPTCPGKRSPGRSTGRPNSAPAPTGC